MIDTKEILIDYCGLNNYHAKFSPIVTKINFEQLDNLVLLLFKGYYAERGADVVESELVRDPSAIYDATIFITHIIEVGSLLIITENRLPTIDPNAVFIVALSLNISIGKILKSRELLDLDLPFFFDLNSQKIIELRVINHLANAACQENYITDLVDNYLFQKIHYPIINEIFDLFNQ
jgi:hypothetical protein